ncbi:MAG: rRNA pseudouridine synthase [Bacteroidota bacterium]
MALTHGLILERLVFPINSTYFCRKLSELKIQFKDLILFENDNYLIINKPAGISSLDERGDSTVKGIIRLAKEYSEDAQLGHRLDKETSGCLVIAKNPEAYRHISMQFEHREVNKKYHAVVEGQQEWDGILVNFPILPLKDGKVIIDRHNGKHAETWFQSLRVYRNCSLVECMPITGRMHQIRIHLTCLKAPILMDSTYGGPEIYLSDLKRNFSLGKGKEENPLIKRVALHAYSIQFKDLNNEIIEIQAPYPKDFEVLIKLLEKYS